MPKATETPLAVSSVPPATLQSTATAIVLPGVATGRPAAPTAGVTSVSAVPTARTTCAPAPFAFTQVGSVPSGPPALVGRALRLGARATLLSPDRRFALVAPATLPAALTITFSSATVFTVGAPAGTSLPGGLSRLATPLRVLLPPGLLLSIREPSTGQFRAIYDKRISGDCDADPHGAR